MAELAACRFCDWVEIELGAEVETQLLGADRCTGRRYGVDGNVERVDCRGRTGLRADIERIDTQRTSAVRSSSVTVMVSADDDPTRTVAPAANALVPSSRLCPL